MKLNILSTTLVTGIWLFGANITKLNSAVAFDISQSVTNAVLQDASVVSGLPVLELQIINAEPVIWSDGCLGVYHPNTACTMALVDGWRVTVESQQKQWVYHTDNRSTVRLANGENSDVIIDLPFPSDLGASQENPLLPDLIQSNEWIFQEVRSGRWYDPPTAYGFQYEMTSTSVFTHILNFPVGIDDDNLFTVKVGDTLLGQFSPGQTVDFVSLLGQGVSKFTVTDIHPLVDPQDPVAFPIHLAFNTPTASFKMAALSEQKSVPEPAPVLGLLAFGAWGITLLHKRHKCNFL